MRWPQQWVMAGRILEDVAVDGLTLQAMQLWSERALSEGRLSLRHRVESSLSIIHVAEIIVGKVLIEMSTSTLSVGNTCSNQTINFSKNKSQAEPIYVAAYFESACHKVYCE